MNPKALWCAALAVAACLAPTRASAYTLFEDVELKLDAGAWAQVLYQVSDDLAGDFSHGPSIGLARLYGGATYKSLGRAFVQVDGSSGDVLLSDVFAEVRPTEALAVRMGRFKVPTSADFLVSAPSTPFANRSMLVGFVQKRLLGAQLSSTLSSDSVTATAEAGWFQPAPSQRALLPDGEGNFVSVRGLVELPVGLSFHGAYQALVLADNDPVVPPDDPMGTPVRPVDLPEIVDAAVSFSASGWTAAVEGLVAPNTGEPLPWATYGQALYSFPISEQLDLEPGVRYGIASRNDVLTHRATGGLNLYIVENRLAALVNYELSFRESDVGHAGYLQLQAGL